MPIGHLYLLVSIFFLYVFPFPKKGSKALHTGGNCGLSFISSGRSCYHSLNQICESPLNFHQVLHFLLHYEPQLDMTFYQGLTYGDYKKISTALWCSLTTPFGAQCNHKTTSLLSESTSILFRYNMYMPSILIHLKMSIIGMPGWLSWLSLWLLILAQFVIFGSSHDLRALRLNPTLGSALSREAAWDPLSRSHSLYPSPWLCTHTTHRIK